MKRNKRLKDMKETIKSHVINNRKEYIIVTLFFVIGIFAGVFFVNYMEQSQKEEVGNYLTTFIEKMKTIENMNQWEILKKSMKQNIVLAVIIWFFGTTVIGLPVVFGMVLYRGFCLGYTIAISISMMGFSKGLSFVLISLLLQSILFIPAILALAVSGFKLYQSITKDTRKENIKLEMIRHTVFSTLMLLLLVFSSGVEVFGSMSILKLLVKYM